MQTKKTALIMAGGRGERFWPYSRQKMPKQFISLTPDGKTMIQLTVERILPMVDVKDIFIATNAAYRELVCEQLPQIPEENILCEPVGRNTAPCIGMGAVHIERKYGGDALMFVLASDHLIKHNAIFLRTLADACDVALEGNNLVTIGITPDYPETGYGYVKFNENHVNGQAFAVERFIEKPDLETAKAYLKEAQYLWNSGMFIWKVSSILHSMRSYMQETYEGLLRIQEAIGTPWAEQVMEHEFTQFASESIDYGIMEKASDIYILPGSFGWNDVGSWLAMERINPTGEHGNVVKGNFITIDTKGCILQGGEKLVAVVGAKNLVVIDTKDAMLICEKDSTGSIRKVLENLRICNRTEYL